MNNEHQRQHWARFCYRFMRCCVFQNHDGLINKLQFIDVIDIVNASLSLRIYQWMPLNCYFNTIHFWFRCSVYRIDWIINYCQTWLWIWFAFQNELIFIYWDENQFWTAIFIMQITKLFASCHKANDCIALIERFEYQMNNTMSLVLIAINVVKFHSHQELLDVLWFNCWCIYLRICKIYPNIFTTFCLPIISRNFS